MHFEASPEGGSGHPPGATSERTHTSLDSLGWNGFLEEHFHPFAERGLSPARVAGAYGVTYRLYLPEGEIEARLPGRFRHQAAGPQAFPVVGDWVAIARPEGKERADIQAVLPRQSAFSRKAAGRATEEQVLVANVDTVLVVAGLDHDFNPRRLERYLVVTWESGAQPVVVLNKTDQSPNLESAVESVAEIAPGVPVHPISARTGQGVEHLSQYLVPGQTVGLLGSSGVGKSTLINRLVGRDLQRTGEVRFSDSRGRHTTTHRELILLPSGGMVVDTPGLRELQLWEADSGHQAVFDDIDTLAAQCHFPDCTHQTEPRCAVRQAIADGILSEERLESYLKLQDELRQLERRLDQRAQLKQKREHRTIHKQMRSVRPRQ